MNPPTDSEAALLTRASYYTILNQIPALERAAWVEQAEACIPLSAEQQARLGLSSKLGEVILLPGAPGGLCSPAQLRELFPKAEALAEVLFQAVLP